MLSLENAATPPANSTTIPKMTIGRRVKAKLSMAFSIVRRSPRRRGKCVAQEKSPVGRHALSGRQPFDDLVQAFLLQPYFDGALHQTLAVGGDPHRHAAVAFAHHTRERNGWRPSGL